MPTGYVYVNWPWKYLRDSENLFYITYVCVSVCNVHGKASRIIFFFEGLVLVLVPIVR